MLKIIPRSWGIPVRPSKAMVSRAKKKEAVVFFFILAAALLSIGKMSFLAEMLRASLTPNTRQEEKISVLAKVFFENKRSRGMIKEKFSEDQRLDVYLAMEMIKKGGGAGPQDGSDALLSSLPEKFPENVFLDNLGLYSGRRGSRDWENFDVLFFKILSTPAFNSTSREILMRSIRDQRISPETLGQLILYLSWMKNYELAGDLLDWGFKEKELNENTYGLLRADWLLRKSQKGLPPARSFSSDRTLIEKAVDRAFRRDKIKINWAENQISDGSLVDPGSLEKHWILSDMSDYPPFAKGSFYEGFDSVKENSLRVMGFFILPAADKSGPRAGFWYRDEIPLAEKRYLFFFRYQTLRGNERPTFFLSRDFGKEWILEPANFRWREVCYIFDNGRLKIPSIRPLLRIWGKGAAWFDDIGLFEVESGEMPVEKDILVVN